MMPLGPAPFTGYGVPPHVLAALSVTSRRVVVYFTEEMSPIGLNVAGNFTITPDVGSAARSVLTAVPNNITNPTYVTLTLDGDTTVGLANYAATVAWTLTDRAGNVITAPLSADFNGLAPSSTPAQSAVTAPFPLDMYRFIIREIRTQDQNEGARFLERYLIGPNALWSDTVDSILSIPNLWSIDNTEDRFLKYLKNIVGWVDRGVFKKITSAIDDAALRRLISVSGALWRGRGTESTILDVLQLLAKARCRIWNWFDFRWVLDENALGEEHQGRDPWVINLPATLVSSGPPPVYTFDEYRSNLRIVDNGSLDRTLVKRIVNLMRPIGERYDITYLLFLDLFSISDDDIQWDHPASLALTVDSGMLQLIATGGAEATFAIVSGAIAWSQYVVAARFRGHSNAANARFGLVFYRTNATNYYEVVVDTFSQELRLRKVVAGVTTNLVTVNLITALFTLYPDIFYTVRASVVRVGATNQIVVTIDGATMLTATDPDLTAGSVGLRHDANATIQVDEVEVWGLPGQAELLDINSDM